MKFIRYLWLGLAFSLAACQAGASQKITLLDEGRIYNLQSSEKLPLNLLAEANLTPQLFDRVLFNGMLLPLDQPLPISDFVQLQLRRAMPLTIHSPEGQKSIVSAAWTVGEALQEAGYQFYAHDRIEPPLSTPINAPLSIYITPAKALTVTMGGQTFEIRSASPTVGEALAEAGIPLVGLDSSFPSENEALPEDGQIRVIHIREALETTIKAIPYPTEKREAQDVPLGQEKIIQPGVNGLALTRTRIRYEDGQEVGRTTESESILREPQTQIVAHGSQVVLAPVGGDIPYEYWTAVKMYATVYSPCNSGTGSCSYGTASGARAGYGIVAMDYSIYGLVAGMKVYIPGYGVGTIGDTGGGPIVESAFGVPRTQWIDLGFDDGNLVDMTGWVTVYFLAPAPAEIPYFLK
ncbi:MAG: DUF348 domain-containing protein [Anaerolineales bacterium]|nr:DUF348 domain-containing protein [Anaerolineales bacterium]